MVFNATNRNMSVISWLSVLLVEEGGISGGNQRPVGSHWRTLSHNVISYRVHLAWEEFELTTLVVIGTRCIGSHKSNYHTITTMTARENALSLLVSLIIFWNLQLECIFYNGNVSELKKQSQINNPHPS